MKIETATNPERAGVVINERLYLLQIDDDGDCMLTVSSATRDGVTAGTLYEGDVIELAHGVGADTTGGMYDLGEILRQYVLTMRDSRRCR